MLKNLSALQLALTEEINKWNQNYRKLKIQGTIFEHLLVNALDKIKEVGEIDWDPSSHKEGKDITFKEGGKQTRVSVKTGKINSGIRSAPLFQFSSYRMTSHKSLEEKIAYIKHMSETFDYYTCLFRADSVGQQNKLQYKYLVLIIPSKLITPEQVVWQEGRPGHYEGQGELVNLSIRQSMSDQLWVELKDELVNHPECVRLKI